MNKIIKMYKGIFKCMRDIRMITLSTIVHARKFDDILSTDSWFFKFKSDLITTKLLIISNIIETKYVVDKLDRISHSISL